MNKVQKITQEFLEMIDETCSILVNIKESLNDTKETISLGHEMFNKFLSQLESRLNNYKIVIKRNYLKCVFIGRTSCGKSTTINALLNDEILPMGIGHTTNCFITLQATDNKEGYVEHFTGNSKVPGSITSMSEVKNMANALSPTKAKVTDVIQINYSISKGTKIINQHVKILDTPGLDIDMNYEEMIENHCLDADVFILVCNAESVLMQCERNFFYKVKEKFSKPNLIIINNRWDSSDEMDDQEMAKVKKQQMDIFTKFLVKDLKICTETEVKSKIYFISSSEMVKERKSNAANAKRRDEREREFRRFEKTIEKLLSNDSLVTKLKQNFNALEQCYSELTAFVNCLYNTVILQKEHVKKELSYREKFLTDLETKLAKAHRLALNFIQSTVRRAKEKIISDFRDYACQLDTTINHVTFTFDAYSMREYADYQKLLIDNIENSINNNLITTTMTSINETLLNGLRKQTVIYRDLLFEKVVSPKYKGKTPVTQSPVLHQYPEFSTVMNGKIDTVINQLPAVPVYFTSSVECYRKFTAFPNRFTGASAGNESSKKKWHDKSETPDVTLIVPKFSTVIMSDFTYSTGFRFTLAPASIKAIGVSWMQSNCSVPVKLRLLSMPLVVYVFGTGAVGYFVVYQRPDLLRHGAASLVLAYVLFYIYERVLWNAESEMLSLKNQFVHHTKRKIENIIIVSSSTTARQLGSFLHMDLKGLQMGCDGMISDFRHDVELINKIDKKVSFNLKRVKDIKISLHALNQQMVNLKTILFDSSFNLLKQNY